MLISVSVSIVKYNICISGGRSSAGRASRSQCEGREFDPPRLHHYFWTDKKFNSAAIRVEYERNCWFHETERRSQQDAWTCRCARAVRAAVLFAGRRDTGRVRRGHPQRSRSVRQADQGSGNQAAVTAPNQWSQG